MVLGLGDTNYDQFCAAGKAIDAKMEALGARRILPLACADDATGLDQVVEPWLLGLWNALHLNTSSSAVASSSSNIPDGNTAAADTEASSQKLNLKSVSFPSYFKLNFIDQDQAPKKTSNKPRINSKTTRRKFDQNNPYFAKLSRARMLTSSRSEKQVIHLELDISDYNNEASSSTSSSGMITKYSPGDAVGIICQNPDDRVDEIIARLTGISSSSSKLSDIASRKFVLEPLPGTDPSVYSMLPSFLFYDDDEVEEEVVDYGRSSSATEETAGNNNANDTAQMNHRRYHRRFRPCSIREALLRCDLSVYSPLRRPIFCILAKYCTSEADRDGLLHLADAAAFTSSSSDKFSANSASEVFRVQLESQRADLADLLRWFPSCSPDFAHLLQYLGGPVHPRFYSIASSPLLFPNHVHVAVTIVDYETPPPGKIRRKGLCSSWLHKLCTRWWTSEEMGQVPEKIAAAAAAAAAAVETGTGEEGRDDESTNDDPYASFRIPIFLRDSAEFRLPQDISAPVIMVGPGTGVAPFRAFLQHRQSLANVEPNRQRQGNMILFYGCRSAAKDFLYKDELRLMEKESHTAALVLAATTPNSAGSSLINSSEGKKATPTGFQFEMHVAFSQENADGLWYGGSYVQDLLLEQSRRLYRLLFENEDNGESDDQKKPGEDEQQAQASSAFIAPDKEENEKKKKKKKNAYLYVCGDAPGMARDVQRVLVEIITSEAKVTVEKAQAMLEQLANEKRFQKDVWT